MPQDNKRGRQVRSIHTAFGIIELIDELGEAGITTIADEMDLAKSTVHDHLSTFLWKEYVVKDEDIYSLSSRFLSLGLNVRERYSLIPAAEAPIEQLAEETGEVVWLKIEEHGWDVSLLRGEGEHAVPGEGKIGERAHMHHNAGGKVILAHLPEERVREIIRRRGLPEHTENTITDPEVLFDELEEIRERGYAFNDEERISGIRSIGVPIFADGCIEGATVVAGPTNRMIPDRFYNKLPEKVLGTANEIELKLTYE